MKKLKIPALCLQKRETQGRGTRRAPITRNCQTGAPIKQTFFGDESLLPGIEYYYSVTAVDKSGNESPETRSQMVMVPKTVK